MGLKIKIGCDLVNINRFSQIIDEEKKSILNALFSPSELIANKTIQNLAGVFAAKESVVKALGLQAGNWHLIEIFKDENGKPNIKLHDFVDKTIISHDISISHDGDYVVATSSFLIDDIK